MGDGAGSPTPDQMAKMKADVALALDEGAFGVSSALIYPPESFQTTEDLIQVSTKPEAWRKTRSGAFASPSVLV